MGKVQGIVWDLTHAEATVECVWDPTLHLGSLGKGRNGNAGMSSLHRSHSRPYTFRPKWQLHLVKDPGNDSLSYPQWVSPQHAFCHVGTILS